MINSLDVTISGTIENTYTLPNDNMWDFHFCKPYFKAFKTPRIKTLNLVNIESFEEAQYPIVEHTVTEKPYGWFKKLWYANTSKLYNVEHKVVGLKTVTWVTMRSREKYMIDESALCLKNALDACVWNADIKSILQSEV